MAIQNRQVIHHPRVGRPSPTPLFGGDFIARLRPEWQNVAPGVEHLKVITRCRRGPLIINALRIDPRHPDVSVEMRPAVHTAPTIKRGLAGMRSLADQFVPGQDIAGTNATFFRIRNPAFGLPVGLSIRNGRIITGPMYARTVMGVTASGEIRMEKVELDGRVSLGNGALIRLDNVNQIHPTAKAGLEGQTVLFTPDWGEKSPTPPPGMRAVRIRNGTIAKVAENQRLPIPKDGSVLILPDEHPAIKKLAPGITADVSLRTVPDWSDVQSALAGGPRILENGRVVDRQAEENFNPGNEKLYDFAPRTGAGVTKDGQLILVTVDGRQPGISEGVSLEQLGRLLKRFGAVDGLNFDGGGSTQMVIEGEYVNSPSQASFRHVHMPGPVRPVPNGIFVSKRQAGKGVKFGSGSQPKTQVIIGADVLLPEGGAAERTVTMKDGKIAVVSRLPVAAWRARLLPGAEVIRAPENSLLAPGLIEQHIHGGYGVNFNLSSPDAIKALLKQLPQHGITAIVPTVMTGTETEMMRALENLDRIMAWSRENPGRVKIAGIHLEGPFISLKKRGAHDARQVRRPGVHGDLGIDLLARMLAMAPGIRLVTMAPELDPDGRVTRYLTERGIKVSAGHTCATAEQMEAAIGRGVTGLTHAFNAMPGLHHREPGPVSAVMESDKVFPEIIADGHHVNPAMIKLLADNTPNLVAVSDASPLAGLADGASGELGGQPVTLQGGQVVNAEGNLAGSGIFVTDSVRNFVRWGLKKLDGAIRLATENPGRFLGLQTGQIKPGLPADLTLWDKDTLQVMGTWIDGNRVY